MEINEILCKETGKVLKADSIYKVKNSEDGCVEEIVSTCFLCPYSESKRAVSSACKSCYGTITQSKKKFRKEQRIGNHSVEIENHRNTFEIDELGEYIKFMEADEFMNFIDKVANLNSLNWNHGQKTDDKLRAYDKPKSWKSDCLECRNKCKNNNIKTQCMLAKEYLENKFGISLENMSDKHLTSEIPTEFICQNQSQIMYYI